MFKLTDINLCMLYLCSRLNSFIVSSFEWCNIPLETSINVTLKQSVFWDATLCRWVKEPRHFKTNISSSRVKISKKNFSSTLPQNTGLQLPIDKVSYHRRTYSSAAPLWKPQNLHTQYVCIELR